MSDMARPQATVSVIMSLYNPNLKYLAEQLDSIAAQDFDDFEVIIYNDNPRGENLSSFCQKHLKGRSLQYYPTERNRGYIKAFEHLTSLAEGKYLAFCDQDDVWDPLRLSEGVRALESGPLLVTCDRRIIDSNDKIVCRSWRQEHSNSPEATWNTGDDITARAVFTCYAIGMATMIRAETAKALMPFPTCTGHDKWLVLGASVLGTCAFIDKPLVSYRRHTRNETGTLSGVTCKQDWYVTRTCNSLELAEEFSSRFPLHKDVRRIMDFAQARVDHNIRGIRQNADLAPAVARFEITLRFVPDWAFRLALRAFR